MFNSYTKPYLSSFPYSKFLAELFDKFLTITLRAGRMGFRRVEANLHTILHICIPNSSNSELAFTLSFRLVVLLDVAVRDLRRGLRPPAL